MPHNVRVYAYRRNVILRLGVVAICLLLAATAVAADWGNWRGPSFRGVAEVSYAPEAWSHAENVGWRAEIEGYGISSPVAVGNRVYVTTATQNDRRSAIRLAGDLTIGFLAALGIPMLVILRLRVNRSASTCRVDTGATSVQYADTALFGVLATAVATWGVLTAIGPDAVDRALSALRDVGVASARLVGREQTNFWFLAWDETNRHNTWIMSSAAALASIALTPFLFTAHSAVRPISSIVLLVGVAAAFTSVPWLPPYGDRYPSGILVVFYAPILAVAVWHAVLYLVSHGGLGTPRWVRQPFAFCSLPSVLSATLIVSPNFLNSTETMIMRRVVCLDAATGQRLWHRDVFATRPEPKSAMNSYATPTPTVTGDRIVAAFGAGVAVLTTSGDLLWSRTFPEWIANSVYGAASSPVIHGDVVFIGHDREYEGNQPSRLTAYAVSTGEALWTTALEFAHDGYTTPVPSHDGHRTLLLTVTSKMLAAIVASTGELAWAVKTPIATPIPSLIAEDGKLYVTGGKGDQGYTAAFVLRQGEAPIELWRSARNPADVSSPVLYKGRLFTISSTGLMICYDAASGAVLWRQRIGSGLGVFYASLVAADDKVYATRSNGTTYVVGAEDRFRLISENSLPDDMFASPAFSADCLFLRTVTGLYCIRRDATDLVNKPPS